MPVTAGDHEIRFQVTRQASTAPFTPVQNIDNVVLSGSAVPAPAPSPAPVPEPATLATLGLLAGCGAVGYRRRTANKAG